MPEGVLQPNLPAQVGRLLKPGLRFGQAVYSAAQMHEYAAAYAADCVAAETKKWEAALVRTWQMVDPYTLAGAPGSYARGQESGIVAALTTLRQNLAAVSQAVEVLP